MIEACDIEDFLAHIDRHGVIDARSESEFAKGHIPGSFNVPLLTNEHRVQVGTLYKQLGKEAAILKGFQLAGPRFYDIFKSMRKHAEGQALGIYCWRGGMRSNILAWMMNLADYKVSLLKGGYKSYRQYVHRLFEQPWKWVVVSGKTGVGKTKVLHALKEKGQQVLDFEGLAHHKGSAFGHLGEKPQPSVEQFENLIGWELRRFDPDEPIWIENESRFIGTVRIPDALFNQTLDMPVIELETSEAKRRKIILDEYGRFPVNELKDATEKLERKLGGDRMKFACEALESGNFDGWLDVLLPYYDKTYNHSGLLRKGDSISFAIENYNDQELEELVKIKNRIWKK
ncbi:MAG: tRNA 2-selenouridine(34) synthase MnmH [Chitinophagaceae bacterium]|nr:tRNA 2-selenouridine(34) synthase MnmH [Chitinophagaceae bacterium]